MKNNFIQFYKQIKDDDFKIEFTAHPLFDITSDDANKRKEILNAIASIEEKQKIIDAQIEDINSDIDRLSNHADNIDYTIAVSCGVLCGIVDSIFIGAFDYEGALKTVENKVNEYVKEKGEDIRITETIQNKIEEAKEKAKVKGIKLTEEDISRIREKIISGIKNTFERFEKEDAENGTLKSLCRAIRKLEEHYKIASDNMYKGIKGMNSVSHHLDDLAHHPTLLGFIAALLGEFLKIGVFTDKNGKKHWIFGKWDDEQKKKLTNLLISIVIAAVLGWLLKSTTSRYKDEIDQRLPKPLVSLLKSLSKAPMAIVVLKHIINVFNNWSGHLASDMAGSKNSPGSGMGIPGVFISILKEISNIPPFNHTGLPKVIHEIYENNRFDMRSEMAVINELGKQAIPVLLGDILTRTMYFVRHLIDEFKAKDNCKDFEWKNVIPFNNRTIARLLVIESGTFTACDIADAAIRSAIKNGCNVYDPKLYSDFILRVNFIGIGRFAIAIGTDVKMGIDRKSDISDRIALHNKILMYDNAILFYKLEGKWLEAKNTATAIEHLRDTAYKSIVFYNNEIQNLDKEFANLVDYIDQIRESDSDFIIEITENMKNTQITPLEQINLPNELQMKFTEFPQIISNKVKLIANLEEKVNEAKANAEKANTDAEGLKLDEGKKFWKIEYKSPDTQKNIENILEVVKTLSLASKSNAEAQELSFKFQQELASTAEYLFYLGCYNIAANESMIANLNKQLDGEETNEVCLSDRVKEQFRNVVQRLMEQKDVLYRQQIMENRSKDHDGKIQRIEQDLQTREAEAEKQNSKLKELENALQQKESVYAEQTKKQENKIQEIEQHIQTRVEEAQKQSSKLDNLELSLMEYEISDIEQTQKIDKLINTIKEKDVIEKEHLQLIHELQKMISIEKDSLLSIHKKLKNRTILLTIIGILATILGIVNIYL